jgi:hypothetical protein
MVTHCVDVSRALEIFLRSSVSFQGNEEEKIGKLIGEGCRP